ncbi:MAG: YbjQ family protein [Myxococcota bacterium]
MDILLPLLAQYAPALLLLGGTYLIGSWIERRHYRILRRREKASQRFAAMTLPRVPEDWKIRDAQLVSGSVVISIDYFKRFLAGLRGLIGGRVRSYETLLDRARREAIMRAKEAARDAGFNAVINLRLETSRLASSSKRREGTAGVEVLAFGTGIRVDR